MDATNSRSARLKHSNSSKDSSSNLHHSQKPNSLVSARKYMNINLVQYQFVSTYSITLVASTWLSLSLLVINLTVCACVCMRWCMWVLFRWCGWVYTSNYASWCMSVLLFAYVCMLSAFWGIFAVKLWWINNLNLIYCKYACVEWNSSTRGMK